MRLVRTNLYLHIKISASWPGATLHLTGDLVMSRYFSVITFGAMLLIIYCMKAKDSAKYLTELRTSCLKNKLSAQSNQIVPRLKIPDIVR